LRSGLSRILVVCYSRGGTTLSLAAHSLAAAGQNAEVARFVRRVAGDNGATSTSGAPLSNHAGL